MNNVSHSQEKDGRKRHGSIDKKIDIHFIITIQI